MHVPGAFAGRHILLLGAVLTITLAAPTPLASGLQHPGRALSAAELWLQPLADPRMDPGFIRAVEDLAAGRPAHALPAFAAVAEDPVLGGYARLYVGRAELALEQSSAAAATARRLLARDPDGALAEAAWWLLVEAAEAAEDWPEAHRALQALAEAPSARESEAQLRLGQVAARMGAPDLARQTFLAVYYEHPATVEGAAAARELAALGSTPEGPPAQELARAEQLFAAGRYTDARQAFGRLQPRTEGEDRTLVALRLAQSDFHLRRHTAALAALEAYLRGEGSRVMEAEFYRLKALQALDRDALFVAETGRFADRHGDHPLVEAALNELGTFYILTNDDELAASVFRTMYARFPTGAFADRAAWKAGWWAYRHGDYRAAIEILESAAAALRRADFRPAWLYWAARAREHEGDRAGALAAHRRVVADYRNLFYGRRSVAEIARLSESGQPVATAATDPRPSPRSVVVPGPMPPNARVIQRLLAVGLHGEAIHEVRRAARLHGTSPLLEATIGYAWHRQGQWRPAITALRRAYPQFMAAGGEQLPVELLRMIYPLNYWDLIRKYAALHRLDPYLMAALMCQESTFQADVRSAANAWGLMQILPATGRRYAGRLGIRPFTTARLTDPEVNVRIGMAYFADLRNRFGRDADALAAYNAGENRLIRWREERPGVALDEFIDDIPFPETQQYVKRVLGTAEDYRILYGPTPSAVPQVSRR
jgi:soluble lytic murein transglycosylase